MVTPLDQRPRSGPYSGLNARSAKRFLTEQFRTAGLPFAEDDALEIVMAATGLDEAAMIMRGTEFLSPEAFALIMEYSERRLSGEPVDHILGWREFYGRTFSISRDVLSPRADTETLIEHALAAIKDIEAPHILDLGTGSGAILITLLAERPDATGVGVDISKAALRVAQDNAKTLNVDTRATWRQGDWFAPLKNTARFDAIISNPPYITPAAMESLETEVKNYDPHIALAGGGDGLEAYRQILRDARDWLKLHGWIGLEIGFDQDAAVRELLAAAGFLSIRSYKDLGGNDRVICAITNS